MIKCEICKNELKQMVHKHAFNLHNVTISEYKKMFPNTKMQCNEVILSKSKNMKGKLAGEKNPSKRPEVREKMRNNHFSKKLTKEEKHTYFHNIAKNAILKGKKVGFQSGDNHYNWTGKTDYWYRKIMLEKKNIILCELCNKTISESNKIHIHHKDYNRKNNQKNNLMILCSKCHNGKIHKCWINKLRDENGKFKRI